jgi:hypothetical protein
MEFDEIKEKTKRNYRIKEENDDYAWKVNTKEKDFSR